MPAVPVPEDCEPEEERYRRLSATPEYSPRVKQFFLHLANERVKSPIAVRMAKEHDTSLGESAAMYMYWMKAKSIPKYDAPFQKCILSYLSDMHFIGTAPRILGLKRFGKGPDAQSMLSTIDHSIYFYDNDFDCGDWLLYVIMSPRTGSGRGVMHGRLYTRDGTLVAVTCQEGVVRADRRNPKSEPKPEAKL
ncbi:hypothetical protein HGRIS_007598 [Hohenbuehelia grisea]|uniref:Acyl-CoA thioesterase-like C-terminal domain-containing protein n=1 Tax=Hohenbuehelia grisea TaxID=104357 RepID=A0ABR3J5Q5_9AGAR